jgi:hypothetical protein
MDQETLTYALIAFGAVFVFTLPSKALGIFMCVLLTVAALAACVMLLAYDFRMLPLGLFLLATPSTGLYAGLKFHKWINNREPRNGSN